MKRWAPIHKPFFILTSGRMMQLHQVPEEELNELPDLYGVPVFYAYQEKWPDGSECDAPLYRVWPKLKLNDKDKCEYGELKSSS